MTLVWLAAFRPPTRLIDIATDDWRISGAISGGIAGRSHNITGGIGIIRRGSSRHRAPRFSCILRERILSGKPVTLSGAGSRKTEHNRTEQYCHAVMRGHSGTIKFFHEIKTGLQRTIVLNGAALEMGAVLARGHAGLLIPAASVLQDSQLF